jgi:hypothetical protein
MVIEKSSDDLEQSGKMHSKTAGRFETMQEPLSESGALNQVFGFADVFGKVKTTYINSAHKISGVPQKQEKSATSIGGELGFNTTQYYGFSAHFTAYASGLFNGINPSKEDRNEDFTDVNQNSFVYVAEASIDYQGDNFQTKIGRIKAETPYANSDDIRMAPNTFEGVWAEIEYTSKLKTQLLYFKRWAGYDSQDEDAELSQNDFKNLVNEDSFGIVGGSLSYEYAKNSEATFWYNYIENMSAITYGEVVGIYFIDTDAFHFDYGLQAANMQELNNSEVEGNVLGAMGILHYNGVFFGAAYNIALVDEGKYITNGFGGGPYYTSLDEATIAAISEASRRDSEALRVGGGYEFSKFGLEGLNLELVYGELYHDTHKIIEKDAIMTYEISDALHLQSTYTHYKSTNNLNNFDRVFVKLDYNF